MAGIASIVAERDSRNNAADYMPPVLPHQLVKLQGLDFAGIIQLQFERLKVRWSENDIKLIEQDFQDLRDAYVQEAALKNALDACDSTTTFLQGWHFVQNQFKYLERFCE